jgi:predicted O-methyltransferase YrrM
MDTLKYIATKFNVDLNHKPPIEIFNINREIMAETLTELNFNLGVEVGVRQGLHAELLCKTNPKLKLYGIDLWEAYSGYAEHAKQQDQFYQETLERLTNYNCTLIRKFSMDAVNDFEDKSLDFVYIDAAHDFKNVAMDVCEWAKKVRPGGIVYGHDYKRSKGSWQNAVKDVIPAYCYHFKINPWFILGEQGHSDGLYREGTQSWMFVKA